VEMLSSNKHPRTDQIIFFLCFINRSGSSHLCDMLSNAGIGKPGEYFNPHELTARCEKWKLQARSEQEYLDEVLSAQPGICGIKLEWSSYQQFMASCNLGTLDVRYIFLRRRDKVRQAISWYRASRTDAWSCFDRPVTTDVEYNFAEINWFLRRIHELELNWEEELAGTGYLPLFYEDLGPRAIEEIALFLGVSVKGTPHSYFLVQRDDRTDEWGKRFIAESLVARSIL